jgi:hypothetical protein
MIQPIHYLTDDARTSPKFAVRRNGHRMNLSYPELFAIAFRVWNKQDYRAAIAIFQELSKVTDHGPRAQLFLAHCHAMLEEYSDCSSALHRALPKAEFDDLAPKLHDTFVLWKVGLFLEVKQTLEALIGAHPELPSLSLFLAGLLHQSGAVASSARIFRGAIQADRPGGGVALAAHAALKAMDRN